MEKHNRITIHTIQGDTAFFTCNCGTEKTAEIRNIRSGKIKSCGCLRKENFKSLSGRKGSEKANAKLTEADIPVIRKAIGEGRTAGSIAIKYGVHGSVISNIGYGKSWKHV